MHSQAGAWEREKEYKILKGLKKENLRDNMTNTELILPRSQAPAWECIQELIKQKTKKAD